MHKLKTKIYLIIAILFIPFTNLFSQEALPAPAPEPVVETHTPTPQEQINQHEYLLERLRENAIKMLGEKFYKQALEQLLKYRDETKKQEHYFADATILLIDLYIRTNKIQKAKETLEYYYKQKTTLKEKEYIDELTYCKGAILAKKGKWQEAINTLRKLYTNKNCSYNSRNKALAVLASCYIHLQEWDTADNILKTQLQEYPDAENSTDAKFGRIKVLIALNKMNEAATILKAVKNILDKETRPDIKQLQMYKLHNILYKLKTNNLTEALEIYLNKTTPPTAPNSDAWIVVTQLADALIKNKKYADAEKILPHLRILASNKQEKIKSLLQLAENYIAENKANLAINPLEEIKNNYPEYTDLAYIQLKLAELLRANKSYITAGEYFQAVINDKSIDNTIRYRAAIGNSWCYKETGEYEKAMISFNRAATYGSTNQEKADALYYAGDAAFHIKKYGNAALNYGYVANKYPKTTHAEKARINQAESCFKNHQFHKAVQLYALFQKEYPKSNLLEKAIMEEGISLRGSKDFDAAINNLTTFVKKYPKSKLAPCALMEAFLSAKEKMDNPSNMVNCTTQAIQLLTQLINNYPDSQDYYPQALYNRATLFFESSKYKEALADTKLFLKKYPKMPLGADLLFRSGDHYANILDLKHSQESFNTIAVNYKEAGLKLVPQALYETARIEYQRQELSSAVSFLTQLKKEYPTAPTYLKALAAILHGDILAQEGKYEDAIAHFNEAYLLQKDTRKGIAALGRKGDMLYSIGSQIIDKIKRIKKLNEAISCFDTIIDHRQKFIDLKEMANYRKAKCYEKRGEKGDIDRALFIYQNIILNYEHAVEHNKIKDWFYIVRSVHDAVLIYIANNEKNKAKALLNRAKELNLPISPITISNLEIDNT